jgi:hypothetical protein
VIRFSLFDLSGSKVILIEDSQIDQFETSMPGVFKEASKTRRNAILQRDLL